MIWMRFLSLLSVLAVLVSASALAAQEAPADAVSGFAAPCDFTVDFPEKPYVTRRCKGSSGSECYDILTYTRVFDLSNAVTVKATCNPAAAGMADRLSEDVMKATLESMVARKSVGQYDLKFSDRSGVRSATLFGEGVKGVTPTLYVAQMWLGSASLLTVEAELTGDANPQADSLFSEILKSIRLKGDSAPVSSEEKSPDAQGQDDGKAKGESDTKTPTEPAPAGKK